MQQIPWSRRLDFGPLDFYPDRPRHRVIGLSFPANQNNLGLEPAMLTVLPEGDNVEFACENIDFPDADVDLYLCSVYISGLAEFRAWAIRHDRRKIVVGGYHPTMFPEDFLNYADKIVQGPCDDVYATIAQEGQVVQGITSYKKMPRYDLYDIKLNQQVIPDKRPLDLCTSICTSTGCPYNCPFCCTPTMARKLMSKPIGLVEQECAVLRERNPKWIFIRDENFPLQRDWRERLRLINGIGARIYLFASANRLTNEEDVKFFAQNGVYMVCLGLEDVTKSYQKNEKLEEVVRMLKRYGIYTYLSFIVNPLEIVGREEGAAYYQKLMDAFNTLGPEMVCGNFLMPFKGTPMYDQYYAHVSEADYAHYDSKTPFLVHNEKLREKMKFFLFWYQWLYFTSDFYNKNVRRFDQGDTLYERFVELERHFRARFPRYFDQRC